MTSGDVASEFCGEAWVVVMMGKMIDSDVKSNFSIINGVDSLRYRPIAEFRAPVMPAENAANYFVY